MFKRSEIASIAVLIIFFGVVIYWLFQLPNKYREQGRQEVHKEFKLVLDTKIEANKQEYNRKIIEYKKQYEVSKDEIIKNNVIANKYHNDPVNSRLRFNKASVCASGQTSTKKDTTKGDVLSNQSEPDVLPEILGRDLKALMKEADLISVSCLGLQRSTLSDPNVEVK